MWVLFSLLRVEISIFFQLTVDPGHAPMSFCPKMWYTYKWPLQFRIILISLFSFDIWICLENGDTVPQNCHFDGENDDQPSNFAVYFGRTHVKKMQNT